MNDRNAAATNCGGATCAAVYDEFAKEWVITRPCPENCICPVEDAKKDAFDLNCEPNVPMGLRAAGTPDSLLVAFDYPGYGVRIVRIPLAFINHRPAEWLRGRILLEAGGDAPYEIWLKPRLPPGGPVSSSPQIPPTPTQELFVVAVRERHGWMRFGAVHVPASLELGVSTFTFDVGVASEELYTLEMAIYRPPRAPADSRPDMAGDPLVRENTLLKQLLGQKCLDAARLVGS